jgi:hypothetical protein
MLAKMKPMQQQDDVQKKDTPKTISTFTYLKLSYILPSPIHDGFFVGEEAVPSSID